MEDGSVGDTMLDEGPFVFGDGQVKFPDQLLVGALERSQLGGAAVVQGDFFGVVFQYEFK